MADDKQVEETAVNILFRITWRLSDHWLREKAPSVQIIDEEGSRLTVDLSRQLMFCAGTMQWKMAVCHSA